MNQLKVQSLPVVRYLLRQQGSPLWSRAKTCLQAAVLCLFAGCSSAPTTIAFLNNSHRQIYSLSEEDLKKIQFFASTDIVAQNQDPIATKSFLVPKLTPGLVTAAGPNWLKVSFREGGVDVPFVADPTQNDSRYWIASEVNSGTDFKKVTDVPGMVFIYKGTPFTLVSGADALLLIDWESWKRVVDTRAVTEGRRIEQK